MRNLAVGVVAVAGTLLSGPVAAADSSVQRSARKRTPAAALPDQGRDRAPGQFIQAPKTGDVVKISSLSEPWYAATYVGARPLG